MLRIMANRSQQLAYMADNVDLNEFTESDESASNVAYVERLSLRWNILRSGQELSRLRMKLMFVHSFSNIGYLIYFHLQNCRVCFDHPAQSVIGYLSSCWAFIYNTECLDLVHRIMPWFHMQFIIIIIIFFNEKLTSATHYKNMKNQIQFIACVLHAKIACNKLHMKPRLNTWSMIRDVADSVCDISWAQIPLVRFVVDLLWYLSTCS